MQEKTLSVESAYAAVRREATRLQILKPTTSSEGNTSLGEVEIGLTGTGTGMKSPKNCQTTSITTRQGRQKPPPLYSLRNEETNQGELLQNRRLSRMVGRF